MSSKKNGSKKLFDGMPVEPEHGSQPDATTPDNDKNVSEEPGVAGSTADVPAEIHPSLAESRAEEDELSHPDQNRTVDDENAAAEPQADAQASQEESQAASPDELLEAVRRSLLEEEATHEQEAQPKWWQRIGRGSRKNTPKQEAPKVEEINMPASDAPEMVESAQPEVEDDLDSIDDLIDLLGKEEVAAQKPAVVEETPPEPEQVVDVEELKKQAFQPRSAGAQEEDLTEVRSIALEGGEEVFVEVQSTRQDPLEERLSAMENALKPYRRTINFGLALLGLIMAVIAGLVLFNMYKQSVAAAPAPEVVSNLPFPTSVNLPGGWSFQLGKGALDNGQWNPKGAEWLQGTEVCRWVALPWSRQLEAVIRTLNQDDSIRLGMSNNDTLTYQVHSIEQMSPEEMQKLDSNKPCLLIVLAEPEAETRWVLTALP